MGWSGYLRPVQFLDHLTVIIIVTNVHKLKTWASSSELAHQFLIFLLYRQLLEYNDFVCFELDVKIVFFCTIGNKNASEMGQTDSCLKSNLTVTNREILNYN